MDTKTEKLMKQYYTLPLLKIIPCLKKLNNFVLLETNKYCRENRFSYLFINPLGIIKHNSFPSDGEKIFSQMEGLLNNNYLAGFFSYELGPLMENLFEEKNPSTFPLIWLGIYSNVIIFNHQTGKFNQSGTNIFSQREFSPKKFELSNLKMEITKKEYLKNIAKIKEFIHSGNTYQVNYTTKYKFDFSGCPFSFYYNLRKRQPVAYNAFIKTKQHIIISCSPELFFKKKGNYITTRPMKGTIKRGKDTQEDNHNKQFLKKDPKNLSENIMIVDLFRNDLGKISQIGSVKIFDLFKIEKYKTLFQMTSGIKSKLKKNLSLSELFRSLFPSGSVTGAPKIKTMQIIKTIETKARKVYTGAIGFFSPKKEAVFNIPIRTIIINKNKAELGIGSGIVFDSNAEDEFLECKLKAKFIMQKYTDFQLIETILWRNTFYLLNLHLKRIASSAKYFDFFFDKKVIYRQLFRLTNNFKKNHFYKIRLLLSEKGIATLKYKKLPDKFNFCTQNNIQSNKKNLIIISSVSTASNDIFRFHKTTNRDLYNKEYNKYKKNGFFEVIFRNEKNQITEGSISNIFIKKGQYYYTPPVECGLLNGIYRQFFIEHNKNVVEGIISEKDLRNAEEIYICNSIKGMIKVALK